MLSGEAMQRGRYAGFGDGSFDDPPTFQLDADASPRFAFPLNEAYEDDIQDEERRQHKRSLKNSDEPHLWQEGYRENAPSSSVPPPGRSNDLQSYENFHSARLRGHSILDMESVDGGLMLGAETDPLAAPWPHGDYEPHSSRSNDDLKVYVDIHPSPSQTDASDTSITSNQVSPTSVSSNETTTTEPLSHSIQSAASSPMEVTSPQKHAHMPSKSQRASSKAKSGSQAPTSSETRATTSASKKRNRNTDTTGEMTADKDDLFQVSAPPIKRQVPSKRLNHSPGNSHKEPSSRARPTSDDQMSQEAKSKTSLPVSDSSHSASHVASPQPFSLDRTSTSQANATTGRIRATGGSSSTKHPTTPVVTTPNSAAAFKMPSSLPSSYLKVVSSPQTLNSGSNEAMKVDPGVSSPIAPGSTPIGIPAATQHQSGNIYSLMGTSPPDINQTSVHGSSNFGLRLGSQPPPFGAQAPPSTGLGYVYGQTSPPFGLNRSAPNVPNGMQGISRPVLVQSHTVLPQGMDERNVTQTSMGYEAQMQRPSLDLEQLIRAVGHFSAQCQNRLNFFVVHPSSTEEQWSNLENLMLLKRYAGEMNRIVNESANEVQSSTSLSIPNAAPNPLRQHPSNHGQNSMPGYPINQMGNHYTMPSSLPNGPHQHNNHSSYLARPPLPLPTHPNDPTAQSGQHGMSPSQQTPTHIPNYPTQNFGFNQAYGSIPGGYAPGHGPFTSNQSLPKIGMGPPPSAAVHHHFPQSSLPTTPSSPWNAQLAMGPSSGPSS